MGDLNVQRGRGRLSAALFAIMTPFLTTACVDKTPSTSPVNTLAVSTCESPLMIAYHAPQAGVTLSKIEKQDLLISAVGQIPSRNTGASCDANPAIETYSFSQPDIAARQTHHVIFEATMGAPKKALEDSVLAQQTIALIRDGQCEQAWDYLTPLVLAGSSEAAGVLWAASANIFSTGEVGENNGLNATGMSEFGVTGRGLELSLANASLPSGGNDIYTGIDDIRLRAGRFLNIQLEDFVSKSECDFENPIFACRNLAVTAGEIEPLATYSNFLTQPNPQKFITCNRRK